MSAVRLVVSDIDGTLLTSDKVLTERAIRAVERLDGAGITFALTSARPPQGLTMFVEPLRIRSPLGALNGALVVDREMRVLEERTIEREVVAPVIELLSAHGLAVWAYQGSQWFVSDENGPHIEREARSCDCRPTRLGDFSTLTNGITKVVGVSDDAEASAAASAAMRDEFAQRVTATSSQSFFLDVTHPDANKGRVVRFLAAHYGVATDEIMTIGDMHNDVSMFAESGLSVAMGNANDTVRAAASTVTRSNDDEGFAYAIEHFVLGA